jgi:hypothetical protein
MEDSSDKKRCGFPEALAGMIAGERWGRADVGFFEYSLSHGAIDVRAVGSADTYDVGIPLNFFEVYEGGIVTRMPHFVVMKPNINGYDAFTASGWQPTVFDMLATDWVKLSPVEPIED